MYLLKMLTCSALLYGYYRIALYNEKFHQWNRFYLLAAFVVSMVVPIISIEVVPTIEVSKVAQVITNMPWNNRYFLEEERFSSTDAARLILACVSIVLLVKMVVGIGKVIRFYNHNPSSVLTGKVELVITELTQAPFSFFNWLFWRHDINPASENGKRMLNHELTHIREHHSLDKMFTSLVLCIFWMNPFFWIMRRELNMIHEFLADRKAISTNDGAAFAQMVLQAVPLSPVVGNGLINPFFSSQIKRRLIMITTSNKPAYTYLRRLSGLVLMILITTTMALSVQHAEAQSVQLKKQEQVITETRKASKEKIEVPAKGLNGKVTEIKASVRKGDTENLKEAISSGPDSSIKNPPLYILDGKEINAEEMKKMDVGKIATVNIYKGNTATTMYGAKGKNGVVEITTKKDNEPAADKAEVSVSLPGNVLYYLDGKLSSKKEIDKIKPEDIGSINVLKGENAVRKYGNEAKEGVIEIFLKKVVT